MTTMLISLTNNNYGIKTAVHQIKEAVSSLLIEVWRYMSFKSSYRVLRMLDDFTMWNDFSLIYKEKDKKQAEYFNQLN